VLTVGLSPENLSCDGEASAAHIRSESARLNRQKRGLEIAIGHPVDEDDLYDWERQRREYERARKRQKRPSKKDVVPDGATPVWSLSETHKEWKYGEANFVVWCSIRGRR
jgi:hypothetical protein